MYPLDFPLNILRKAKPGEWVLDPFCGRGTTNFAARLCGLPSVGIDINPVATAIASAKMVRVHPDEIINLCEKIINNTDDPIELPSGEFWELCYHRETLREIAKIREYLLKNAQQPAEIALRAIMLGILHGPKNKRLPSYLSNQMPRTYATKPNSAINYWKKKSMKPERVSTLEVVRRKAEYFYGKTPEFAHGIILTKDSRTIESGSIPNKFKWVITSPPYFGMRTYVPDQWLRYWFLGGSSDVAYSIKGQIQHYSVEQFTKELAKVWSRIAEFCESGAKMVIRFGALPSRALDSKKLISKSISLANAGWKIKTIRSAGSSLKGYRQALQFGSVSQVALEEYDIYVILEA